MMKKTLKALLALAAVLFASCSVDYVYPTDYYVVNGSGHDLMVLCDSFCKAVPAGDTCLIGTTALDDPCALPQLFLGSRVQVAFDDGKELAYSCDDDGTLSEGHNILDNAAWLCTWENREERMQKAHYTVTAADYAGAVAK